MSTDVPAEWFEPVDGYDPLPIEWDVTTTFRVNSPTSLAAYEQWLAEHGHTLEDE